MMVVMMMIFIDDGDDGGDHHDDDDDDDDDGSKHCIRGSGGRRAWSGFLYVCVRVEGHEDTLSLLFPHP